MSNLSAAIEAFNVAKANLSFARASKSEKRVILAKDIIAAIHAKWLIPEQSTYLNVDDGDLESRKINECHACALGSVFICALKRDPSLEANESGWQDQQAHMHEQLAPYFDEDQLRLIETAFELDSFMETDEETPRETRALDLGEKYDDADKRLIAIMQNVIKNNGRFVP